MQKVSKRQGNLGWARKSLKNSRDYIETAYGEASEALGALEALKETDDSHRLVAMMDKMTAVKKELDELRARYGLVED